MLPCHLCLENNQNIAEFFYCNLFNNWSVSSVGTENRIELTETELGLLKNLSVPSFLKTEFLKKSKNRSVRFGKTERPGRITCKLCFHGSGRDKLWVISNYNCTSSN